ncbi:hypothetical protein E3O48_00830 [Cryobacterium sp. HLT2-28]|nr:hypothetical protein E3O48_00830 [Cryobacterium sp. HLT2-28]
MSRVSVRTTGLSLSSFAAALLLVGCANGGSFSGQGNSPLPEAGHFLIDQDFADPDVLTTPDSFFAYATNSAAANVQVATSSDLEHWTVSQTDALPELPAWATTGKTWAPDVSQVGPNQFVMYYGAASVDPAAQCIGAATSSSPDGPFTPVGDIPLVCPADEGGAIDPASFLDADGTRYLLWKNDGNCCGLDTWLQIAKVSPDGAQLTSTPTKLTKQTLPWEGHVVEAPTLIRHDGSYALLYSANDYSAGEYKIGYATASSVLGPYTKHDAPLLSTTLSKNGYSGPGGQDVVQSKNEVDSLIFHSWNDSLIYRGMNAVKMNWANGHPVIEIP